MKLSVKKCKYSKNVCSSNELVVDKYVSLWVLDSIRKQMKIHNTYVSGLINLYRRTIGKDYAKKWRVLCIKSIEYAINALSAQ